MSAADAHSTGGVTWSIRQVRAIDSDPMFDGAAYTFSVEAGDTGFEVEIAFAPIYYHLASLHRRRRLPETALELVQTLLDRGVQEPSRVRVSSDGVALHDGVAIGELFTTV